ncbi:MAG TPA: PAS domain S-box protein [Streptosporangiaceae bacterium]|nr:PAS domain S-box protein [Streptosporangiaceae bacterium]
MATRPGQARIDATARAVIDCAADPIIAFGRDRTVCVWNRAAEQMFGWTAAEVLGLEPPIIPRELRAEHNAVLERVANGGNVSLATRRICKAGEVLDLRIDTSELVDAEGDRLGWISVCHPSNEDATVRRYMAERARLVRRLGDVVADMNAELDLEVVLDRIAASLRELTRADAGGFVLIEGDRLRLVSMDGLPADLRGRTADLATSLVGELMRSGNTVLLRTGESGEFDDLIWSALEGLHTITVSLSHVGGKPYGALYALYSRRQVGHVELELLELLAGHASVALSNATAFSEVVRQRAHERAVIDGSADGIAVLDGDGLVRQWNRAAHALTGTSAAQAVGNPPPFPLPEPGAKLTCRLGNGRWIDLLCTVLEGRDEQVIDFRDVTAAKELEEAKDLFLATTSHELRTPITVVQGFASTLANRWDKLLDVDRRGAVQTIAERAESLGRLVDQLLLSSRAGSNRLAVTDEPFDLARLLQDAARVFRPLSDKHILTTDIPPDLPLAHGDAAATDSIVGQLLENAFKYSPDGGTVTIGARMLAVPDIDDGVLAHSADEDAGGGRIEVTVCDEGIGIAAGDLERVFERFVQGEAGDRRRFGGIGLGLYIVRQLAKAQGGDVTAARREGGGTMMRLTLRRARRDELPDPAESAPVTPGQRSAASETSPDQPIAADAPTAPAGEPVSVMHLVRAEPGPGEVTAGGPPATSYPGTSTASSAPDQVAARRIPMAGLRASSASTAGDPDPGQNGLTPNEADHNAADCNAADCNAADQNAADQNAADHLAGDHDAAGQNGSGRPANGDPRSANDNVDRENRSRPARPVLPRPLLPWTGLSRPTLPHPRRPSDSSTTDND